LCARAQPERARGGIAHGTAKVTVPANHKIVVGESATITRCSAATCSVPFVRRRPATCNSCGYVIFATDPQMERCRIRRVVGGPKHSTGQWPDEFGRTMCLRKVARQSHDVRHKPLERGLSGIIAFLPDANTRAAESALAGPQVEYYLGPGPAASLITRLIWPRVTHDRSLRAWLSVHAGGTEFTAFFNSCSQRLAKLVVLRPELAQMVNFSFFSNSSVLHMSPALASVICGRPSSTC
jgi:hypothetical protein